MEFTGGIQNMNFTPISNYNNYLKTSEAFTVDESGMDFENVLQQQTNALQNTQTVQGGVQLNRIDDVAARNSVMSVSETSASGGNFMQSVSNSINGGLNSVNDAVDKANKAQEAFATGEDVSVHDVMIAAEKASLSLDMAMQVRNKLVSAYNEINNVKV